MRVENGIKTRTMKIQYTSWLCKESRAGEMFFPLLFGLIFGRDLIEIPLYLCKMTLVVGVVELISEDFWKRHQLMVQLQAHSNEHVDVVVQKALFIFCPILSGVLLKTINLLYSDNRAFFQGFNIPACIVFKIYINFSRVFGNSRAFTISNRVGNGNSMGPHTSDQMMFMRNSSNTTKGNPVACLNSDCIAMFQKLNSRITEHKKIQKRNEIECKRQSALIKETISDLINSMSTHYRVRALVQDKGNSGSGGTFLEEII